MRYDILPSIVHAICAPILYTPRPRVALVALAQGRFQSSPRSYLRKGVVVYCFVRPSRMFSKFRWFYLIGGQDSQWFNTPPEIIHKSIF